MTRTEPTGSDLDLVMAAAWPPRTEVELGGWTLRATDGVTRRANSVLTIGAPTDLDLALDEAEAFYAARDLPPCFLSSGASTPTDVVDALAQRGYTWSASTSVVWRELDDEFSAAGRPDWQIDVTETPTDTWFDAYWANGADGRPTDAVEVIRRVLLAPAHPAVFVAIREAEQTLAVGQAVVVAGIASVQCLVTAPAARRRGAGRVVVERLLSEAGRRSAHSAVAAVMDDNEPSLGLFAALGFQPSHRYGYFVSG